MYLYYNKNLKKIMLRSWGTAASTNRRTLLSWSSMGKAMVSLAGFSIWKYRVVDPDPVGSEIICRIRIRIRNY